ncbi:MAG: IPT/TIG domain-containing protein [Acidobacteria bacterium]|nr:IPT/TIG domain-containing protein [Acidobacteriota bacterium]
MSLPIFSTHRQCGRPPRPVPYLLIISTALIIGLATFGPAALQARQGNAATAVTVSAANFLAPVAPDSIVATFGQSLATATASADAQPLPETLLGTTVSVRDSAGVTRNAPLLFVSPGQINHLIPAGTAAGEATVEIRSGAGAMSAGTVQILSVAPSIFTASQEGAGVAAGAALRVTNEGVQTFEPLAMLLDGRFISRPIDLGPEGERVFLVLFLTGVRNAPNTDGNDENGSAENVRVLVGGILQTPLFSGAQGTFAGLDQVNVEIPRTLLDPTLPGSRQINVSVKSPGFPDSNEVEIALAPLTGSDLAITGFTAPPEVLANSEILLNGSGISPLVANNKISFGEGAGDARPGEVRAASETQLAALVPFGVSTGLITINSDGRSWTSEEPLRVRTSVSAVVRDTDGQPFSPLFGARVCFPNCSEGGTVSQVQPGGWFVLPDPPPGPRRIFVIEVPTQAGSLNFNRTTISSPVTADRDNPLPQQVYLQAIFGPSAVVGGGNAFKRNERISATNAALARAPQRDAQTGLVNLSIEGFTFSVPQNTDATFPDGSKSGVLTLTPVKNSLTPVPMPPGVFSSAVVQISPFGVQLAPGGTLTFPNRDGLGAAPLPNLYKYDLNSAAFIDTGIRAQLSEDGMFFVTPEGSITETSIYFLAVPQKTTTLVGRVLESDGRTPIRGALVSARGRNATTDGNGGYSLTQVPTGEVDTEIPEPGLRSAQNRTRRNSAITIKVETSYLRPSGRTDSATQDINDPTPGGITNVPTLLLTSSDSNRPPSVNLPSFTTIYATEIRDLPVLVTELDAGQTIANVTVAGAEFASLESQGGGAYLLRLAPQTGDVQEHILTITATDSAGGATSINLTVVVFPLPTAAAQAVATNPNTPVAVTLGGSDADDLPLIFEIVTQPARGTLSGAPPSLTYTPNTGSFGVDSFTFKVSNGIVESEPATVTVTINNPAPVIVSLSPNTTSTLNGTFELKVFGTGFAPNAVVRFNGAARATTSFGATELQAVIPGSDISQPGSASVTVFNPAPGGGESNAETFVITNPAPTIESLSPSTAISEGPGFTLTIKGSDFAPGAIAFWNGAPRDTAFSDSNTLLVSIPASDIFAPGTAQVNVMNPAPGGGETASLEFMINNPAPVLTSISPNTVDAGGPAFVLTLNGSDFRPSSTAVIDIEGFFDLATTYISSTQLTAVVPEFIREFPNVESVQVSTPGPGGGLSNGVELSIQYPVPTLTMISPSTLPVEPPNVGLMEPEITLTGTNFLPFGTVALLDGEPRETEYINSTELRMTLTEVDIQLGAVRNITVFNPSPGGGASAPQILTITNPTPSVLELFPFSVDAGGDGFSLGVIGSNFVLNSVIRVNGVDRETQYLGDVIVRVNIDAAEIEEPGSLSVQVFNPEPEGGLSQTLMLSITAPLPIIDMISPDSTTANGSENVVVTLTGSNFISNAQVSLCGDVPLSTTFVNSTTLEVTLTPDDLITNLVCPFTVSQTDGFTVQMNESPNFTINALQPVGNSLSPTVVFIGDGDFDLTIMGDEFTTRSDILWEDFDFQEEETVFINLGGTRISKTELMTEVPGSLISDVELHFGSHDIDVFTPTPGGGYLDEPLSIFVASGTGFNFGGTQFRSDGTPARSRLAHSQLTDGRIISTGGRKSGGGAMFAIMSLVEAFDPVAEAWTRLANMFFPRENHSATVLGGGQHDGRQAGEIVVIGGRGMKNKEFASHTVEIYDAATNTWRRAADSLFEHIGHTTTRLADGRLLVAGGTDQYHQAHGKAEIYNPHLNSWTPAGELLEARAGHAAVLLGDGRVALFGGASRDAARAGVEIFDPATGLWSSGGSLQIARAGHSTTLLADGRVLLAGGESFDAQATAEIYDPQSGASVLVDRMLTPRSAHTATLLADGDVLITGGLNHKQEATAACEIFSVRTGKWTVVDDLDGPRSHHTAAALDNGRVMIFGNRIITPRAVQREFYFARPSLR